MGNVKINYLTWVFELFRKASSHSSYTLPLEWLVTYILEQFGIQFPLASPFTKSVEEFTTSNLKKDSFKLIRFPSGAKSLVQKMNVPANKDSGDVTDEVRANDEEETDDKEAYDHGGDVPLVDLSRCIIKLQRIPI